MQINVTFKKMEPSESLKSYVTKKLDKFDRMLDGHAEANLVLSIEKIRHIAEVTLTCPRITIHAKEESESMHSSIDELMDKIKGQIVKQKSLLKRHMSGKKKSLHQTQEFMHPLDASSPQDDLIIETIESKPMDVEDAIAAFNDEKQNFLVFSNARTQQVNVLYKHKNGKLGLIQPRG